MCDFTNRYFLQWIWRMALAHTKIAEVELLLLVREVLSRTYR